MIPETLSRQCHFEQARGSGATEGASKNPEDGRTAMLIQGVSTRDCPGNRSSKAAVGNWQLANGRSTAHPAWVETPRIGMVVYASSGFLRLAPRGQAFRRALSLPLRPPRLAKTGRAGGPGFAGFLALAQDDTLGTSIVAVQAKSDKYCLLTFALDSCYQATANDEKPARPGGPPEKIFENLAVSIHQSARTGAICAWYLPNA